MSSKNIGLYLGPAMFFSTFFFFNPVGLNDPSRAVLASSLWIAIWWITEALPISVTALLPIIIFPLSGGMDLATTSAAFGHKFVFSIMAKGCKDRSAGLWTQTASKPRSFSRCMRCRTLLRRSAG